MNETKNGEKRLPSLPKRITRRSMLAGAAAAADLIVVGERLGMPSVNHAIVNGSVVASLETTKTTGLRTEK